MDMNNTINATATGYYFNPNTGQATSNNKNSIPFDREALKAMSQKLRPVESLTGAFKSLPSSSFVDRSNNSISFAAGSTISLNGGYRLVLSAETGANPFVNKYGNTLALMAVEQDFATGGNDQLFGDSVESAIEATRKILDRIDNPIREIPRADQEIYETTAQREREFYTAFLSKLKNV